MTDDSEFRALALANALYGPGEIMLSELSRVLVVMDDIRRQLGKEKPPKGTPLRDLDEAVCEFVESLAGDLPDEPAWLTSLRMASERTSRPEQEGEPLDWNPMQEKTKEMFPLD